MIYEQKTCRVKVKSVQTKHYKKKKNFKNTIELCVGCLLLVMEPDLPLKKTKFSSSA